MYLTSTGLETGFCDHGNESRNFTSQTKSLYCTGWITVSLSRKLLIMSHSLMLSIDYCSRRFLNVPVTTTNN